MSWLGYKERWISALSVIRSRWNSRQPKRQRPTPPKIITLSSGKLKKKGIAVGIVQAGGESRDAQQIRLTAGIRGEAREGCTDRGRVPQDRLWADVAPAA